MQHFFDVEIATKHGVDVAIFLAHMVFWIKKNQSNRRHYYDGRYWTYNSVKAHSEYFSYWTPKQMRRILKQVEKAGLILIGNYNGTTYDRTQWYALSDIGHELVRLPICPNGQMDSPETANGFAQNGKPIPDSNPDIKTESGNCTKSEQPSPSALSQSLPQKPKAKATGAEIVPVDEPLYKNCKTARATPIPPDFTPNDECIGIARQRGLDLGTVLAKFVAHAKAMGWKRADWHAAFRKWILDEKVNNKADMRPEVKAEVRSTVPDYVEPEPVQKASRAVVDSHMDIIRQMLGKKIVSHALA